MRSLLMRVYALPHLRGNVVEDPGYVNESCSVTDLALARIETRITLKGGYVKVQ